MTGARPEVLAPAGSWETLRAAVYGGADAVYFGGRSFNARRGAENFGDDDLLRAVAYCHARGVKAYITFNTMVYQREIVPCIDFIGLICRCGADAVIVQDLGLARLIRGAAPGLRLHASTQMSVHNLQGVEELAQMGFKRVVLARELSREEIRQIAEKSPIELEVFVHGALCMSMSGQCYFSALLGGRSGNRGMCAQTCRLPFSAPGGSGHDLSLKDLALCDYVGELAGLGVSSLKIEGRMKRPEYVVAASAAYKLAVSEGRCPQERMEELKNIFSRSGFTQGYYLAERGRNMFGFRGHEDVLASQTALKGIRARFEGREQPRVPVDFKFTARPGGPCSLVARDCDGNEAELSGMTPEKALNKPVNEEFISDKLKKTGGTQFFAREIHCEAGEGLSLPAAVINRMRREALAALDEKRSRPRPVPFTRPSLTEKGGQRLPQAAVGQELRLRMSSLGQLTPAALAAGAEMIFLPLEEVAEKHEKIKALTEQKIRVGVELPRAIFGSQSAERTLEALSTAMKAGTRDALCGNLGALRLASACGFRIHGDFGLNAANSYSLNELNSLGVSSCVVSFEQSFANIREVCAMTDMHCGLIAYGRLPVMLVRNCPLKNGAGRVCGPECRSGLTDRLGVEFPVRCRGGASEIYNSRPLWLCDRREELKNTGADFAQLLFTVETPGEVDSVLKAWRCGASAEGDFTRGLYRHGAE